MIPDRDIWRAANLVIREYGDGAEFVAAQRADEMLERCDHDGEVLWHRIRQAVVELQAVPAGKPELAHCTACTNSRIGDIDVARTAD
jgi:hypothetical protein